MCQISMKKTTAKDPEEYLTTYKRWDLSALIKGFPEDPKPVFVVHIEPQLGKTGYLEKRGTWIKEMWNRTINRSNRIKGHRTGWTSLLFFSPEMNVNEFRNILLAQLKTSKTNQLKSLALFSIIEGSFDQQKREIDSMSLQLDKIGYWVDHIYPSYFEDGIEIELNHT